ncbi:MAG: sulfotransferase domain-containing protein [Candidatus Nanopelagicaceae bacterium]|nr:sulfotransferase domain-containing protein [Candidatus Nanopelagicaceae bacterium]
MIVWLASYPRSGNTFLRLLCWRVFGIGSSSVYLSEDKMKKCSNEMGIVYFKDRGELREAWIKDEKPHLVKTHTARNAGEVTEIAPNGKAVCVVRNGRASCASYRHYTKDLEGRNISLKTIIEDRTASVHSLNWSDFLDAWDPLHHEDTLLIKYEDILTNPEGVIKTLSGFLGIDPLAAWNNEFEEWQKAFPQFFRKGTANSWKEEWTPELEEVFMRHHGQWMRKLEYA